MYLFCKQIKVFSHLKVLKTILSFAIKGILRKKYVKVMRFLGFCRLD